MTTVTAVTAFWSAEAVCKTSSRSSRLSRGAGAKVKGPRRGSPRKPSGAGCVGGGGARERNEGWPQGRPEWSGLCSDEGVEIAARQYNPYPLTFTPRRTLAGRWKGPWPFHPAQRRVTKFRRGAECPFQRAALLGEATAVAGGKAPAPPRESPRHFRTNGAKVS